MELLAKTSINGGAIMVDAMRLGFICGGIRMESIRGGGAARDAHATTSGCNDPKGLSLALFTLLAEAARASRMPASGASCKYVRMTTSELHGCHNPEAQLARAGVARQARLARPCPTSGVE